MLNIIKQFKNREVKAKEIFTLKQITKSEAYSFVKKYHYLKEAKFFSVYSYGLFIGDELVGCSTFSNPQGISALKSWFGVDNSVKDILELSRLCMSPLLNQTNATSFLLSNSMKMLKKEKIRAVITLADSSRHVGSIYQVCNFKYYGLTDKKTDFFTYDGRVNPRGSTKDVRGVWIPRTRKHRYCYILDKRLKPLIGEVDIKPSVDDTYKKVCCNGEGKVYDKRFNEWYDCPICGNK